MEYGDSEKIATFEQLKLQGEETPLDFFPELDDTENWIWTTYNRLKRLSASEHYITIGDYKAYFELYPCIFDIYLMLDIIMVIDHEVLVHNRALLDAKTQNDPSLQKRPN